MNTRELKAKQAELILIAGRIIENSPYKLSELLSDYEKDKKSFKHTDYIKGWCSARGLGNANLIVEFLGLVSSAKNTVISIQTLPSQIDYRMPYKTIQQKANTIIELLYEKQRKEILELINTAMDNYYYKEIGPNGETASDYDELF